MYAKVFYQIFESSISDDYVARHIFMDMLVLADEEGVIDKTPAAISRITNVPLEIVQHGIEFLSRADPESRTGDEGGRRLVLIDDHRNWGWRIVNYARYRAIRDEEARRISNRSYKRQQRLREYEQRVEAATAAAKKHKKKKEPPPEPASLLPTESQEILQALKRVDISDVEVAGDLLEKCRKVKPDVSLEEILFRVTYFIEKAVHPTSTVKNKAGWIISVMVKTLGDDLYQRSLQAQEGATERFQGGQMAQTLAQRLWKLLGLAASKHDIEMLAQVITLEAGKANCEPEDAAQFLHQLAQQEIERGGTVNVFWFKERKFAQENRNGKAKPGVVKQRLTASRLALAKVLAERGIPGPWDSDGQGTEEMAQRRERRVGGGVHEKLGEAGHEVQAGQTRGSH